MKIFNIMLSKGKGGLETMAHNYTRALFELGHEVYTEMPNYRGFFDFKSKIEFNALVKKHKPDLIFMHGNRAISLAKNVNINKIAVIHNTRFKRDDVKKCNSAIAVSQSFASLINIKTHICANSIELLEYKPRPMPEKPVIGFLGRLHYRKGLDVLIKATTRPILVAGDGPERKILNAPHVKHLGWVDNKQDFFDTVDILVIPSREEPFGLIALEAMSAGIPVIASDVGGLRETVSLLVKPENPSALHDMIEKTIISPPNSLIARKIVEENYSPLSLQNRLAKILES